MQAYPITTYDITIINDHLPLILQPNISHTKKVFPSYDYELRGLLRGFCLKTK